MDTDLERVARVGDGASDRVVDDMAAAVGGLLDINETAERLNVSPRFVRRLVAERRIPYFKIGKYVRIDSDELDAWIRARRVKAADDQAAARSKTNRARSDLSIS